MMKYLLLLSMVFSFSCTKKEITRKGDSATQDEQIKKNAQTIPDVPATVSSSCYQNGTGDQATNYHTLPSVIVHGGYGGSSATPLWSSSTDPSLSGNNQNIFVTDGRFDVRVIAKPSPGIGPDTYGQTCTKSKVDYKKLQFRIGVRKEGSASYLAQYTFNNVGVNTCSNVHSFNVPASSEPLIVDVIDIKWDYSCTHYAQQGFPNEASVCPWDHVWVHDCVEFEVQVSTDFTRSFPTN